ncbi:hypothetical protein [Sporisorium scitamineum]|uniref:Uncharacterized protein n=1 Tax=Sporisorium scitamineum TaxID=49012 RepID=A0A0F7S3Q9_9BASI|nr:hypothetical protein [Sporisorium scitamineum]
MLQDFKKYDEISQHYIYGPCFDLKHQIDRISLHLRSLRNQSGSARAPPVIVAIDDHQKGSTFWLVLISTSSSAAHLVEHVDAETSVRSKIAVPLPTFVGVGFDALLAEQKSLSCASEAFLREHIIAYGRPLWNSLEKRSFWANAKFKLIRDESFQVDQASHCFSVMASRLALSLVPTNSASSSLFARQKMFMDKAVDRHMRIVTRVTDEAAVHVDSPSEPVLAIAASLIMLHPAQEEEQFSKHAGQLAFYNYGSILQNFWQRCLLDPVMITLKGTYGELASRLALMVACDAAKRQRLDDLELSHTQQFGRSPTEDDYVNIISQAVPLETILAGLANLDQGHLAQLRQRIRDVDDGGLRTGLFATQPRGEATNKTLPAWTKFTHFEVLPHVISEITPEYLWACWKRGVALQLAHGQRGIDGIIPVFMGHLDQPFAEADANDEVDERGNRIEMHAARHMTYVAWEAKNQAAPQTAETNPLKAAKIAGPSIIRASMAPPQQEPLTQRALISVLLDLGTKVSFGALDEHAYPCLDFFKIRPIFFKILSADPTFAGHGHLNTMPDPVWNQHVQPSLSSISGAPF